MISFKIVEIKSIESYEQSLRAEIDLSLVDDDVIDKLKKYLGERCDKIILNFPNF